MPTATSIPGVKDIAVTMADTFDPIETGLPVVYQVTARNIGDTAGDSIITFTPGQGWNQLSFSSTSSTGGNSCTIGGRPGGGSECANENLAPGQWMVMTITGSYSASVTSEVAANAVRSGDPDGNPSNDAAVETTQVFVPYTDSMRLNTLTLVVASGIAGAALTVGVVLWKPWNIIGGDAPPLIDRLATCSKSLRSY